MTWTRRKALLGLSSALVAPALVSASAPVATAMFRHGVASGDPDSDSVILWTRVSTEMPSVSGTWELARDATFSAPVQGVFQTDRSRDMTVKVLAHGLEAGRHYFYRFIVNGHYSPVGRTWTLPRGSLGRVGLAVASCSNYQFGHFHAYDAIARDPDVNLVLHLGDYIYEYGADGWGHETGGRIGRQHEPPHEIVSLTDYRSRHAQYKTDPGSRIMHASHPLIPIWDDHESTNNPWMGGAQNHQADEGSWGERRNASLQAFYEWMPVREPVNGQSPSEYWRHYQIGDLVDLVTLETRHTGRSRQIEYADHLDKLETREDAQNFLKRVVGDSKREMLSSRMAGFFQRSMADSVTAGRSWRLVGNQIPMARTFVPPVDPVRFGVQNDDPTDPIAAEVGRFLRLGELNLPIYLDPWDGYPAARERFYQMARKAGAEDLLVLTGDSHAFWQNALFDDSGNPMGLELGTTAISSPGDFLGMGLDGARRMDDLVAQHNPEVIWTNCRYNGYLRLVLERESASADFIGVSDVTRERYFTESIRRMTIVREDGHLRYV